MWGSEPAEDGLHWVWHPGVRKLSVGLVMREGGEAVVVLGQFGERQAKFRVADVVGKVLFLAAEVPQPPEGD